MEPSDGRRAGKGEGDEGEKPGHASVWRGHCRGVAPFPPRSFATRIQARPAVDTARTTQTRGLIGGEFALPKDIWKDLETPD